ncbi:MAG TPA: PadR family transcriptional regulator [Candidatus Angelobacter sp.]|nr:PadR family transcriptional regulator [Candidatus Angelobacter sp.]
MSSNMEPAVKISHTSALILQTINSGYVYGFDIMEITGLPSGTIYPALRRLEKDSFVRGDWEDRRTAIRQDRPPRRYYKLTRQGKEVLAGAVERYPLLARLAPQEKAARR